MLGTNYIITGSIVKAGEYFKFRLNAINVETAVIELAISQNLNIKDSQTVYFAQRYSENPDNYASLSFTKPSISESTIVIDNRPVWIGNPHAAYDEEIYFTAVGWGNNRNNAILNATNNLSAYFGASVSVERSQINLTPIMDYIMGAEIREIWDDKKGSVYALAILNKNGNYSVACGG